MPPDDTRAVTGTGAQPSSTQRKSDCTSFMSNWPNAAVPTYASACSGTARYSSACSCYGITATSKSTTTSTSSTRSNSSLTSLTTASVNSSTSSQSSNTYSTASPTVTSTGSHSSSSTPSSSTTTTTTACPHPSCLSDAQATAAVNSFIYLLANPTA